MQTEEDFESFDQAHIELGNHLFSMSLEELEEVDLSDLEEDLIEGNESFTTSFAGAFLRKLARTLQSMYFYNLIGKGNEPELITNIRLAKRELSNAKNYDYEKFLNANTKLFSPSDTSMMATSLIQGVNGLKALKREILSKNKNLATPAMNGLIALGKKNGIVCIKALEDMQNYSAVWSKSWDIKKQQTKDTAKNKGYTDKNTVSTFEKVLTAMEYTCIQNRISDLLVKDVVEVYKEATKIKKAAKTDEEKAMANIYLQRIAIYYNLGAVVTYLSRFIYAPTARGIGKLTHSHIIMGMDSVGNDAAIGAARINHF